MLKRKLALLGFVLCFSCFCLLSSPLSSSVAFLPRCVERVWLIIQLAGASANIPDRLIYSNLPATSLCCQMVEPSAWNYSRELNFRSLCFLDAVSWVSDHLFHGLPWNLPAVINWFVFRIVGRLFLFISAFGIQLQNQSFTCLLIGQNMIKVESFISAPFAMFTILVRHFRMLICTKQAASAKTSPFWRYLHLHLLSSSR